MASFIKTQYRKIRPTLRFVGRHFFTFCVLLLALKVMFDGFTIFINYAGMAQLLIPAIIIDWWKMKMKFNGGAKQPFIDSIQTPSYRSMMDTNDKTLLLWEALPGFVIALITKFIFVETPP